MTATYSPEDNKLRLYSSERLTPEVYARVKDHGFKWAPKQELFVAPMWTPEREDLLIELCGEITDEDTSLMERQEARSERFEELSEKRASDAHAAREQVASITDGIPLGQPILVGHHSEKHARRDAERIQKGMEKAVKMWDTAKHWEDRATAAIAHAKYKERPDVRARRIKGIEADKRKQERYKAEAEGIIRFWEGKLFAKNHTTGERRPIEITEANREFIFKMVGTMNNCGVRIAGIDGTGWFGVWDILRPDGERYKNCPTKTIPELQEIAIRVQRKAVERYDRWISHYNNRLHYERTMLEADGGTAADQVKPEVGGAIKCLWAPRGGWAYIKKVNKVTVTILHRWRDDGNTFTHNEPLDKIREVMSKAHVDKARQDGRITEIDERGFFLSDEPSKSESHAPTPAIDTDSNDFKAMKESLRSGIKVVSANQLFPTPPDLCRRMVDEANIEPGMDILEPSAGTGNILEGCFHLNGSGFSGAPKEGRTVAVEINHTLSMAIRNKFPMADVHCSDFLQCNGDLGKFDRILMNPPFENGSDIKHIRHAMAFLAPGGRLVAICANGPRQREALLPLVEATGGTWEDLPEGTFKNQGTMVNTAMIVINQS